MHLLSKGTADDVEGSLGMTGERVKKPFRIGLECIQRRAMVVVGDPAPQDAE